MRGRRRAAAALLVALIGCVSACGGGTPRAPDRTSPPPARTSSTVPTPEPRPATSTPPAPTRPTRPNRTPVKPAGQVLGADASWPQCPRGMGIPQKRTEGKPMPSPAAQFVVLGLTNGVSFVANPCLADQVQWVKDRHLLAAAYSVVTYPDERTLAQLRDGGPYDGGTRLGALRNVGYQAARFNLETMTRAGLQSPVVWIDVEPVTGFPWSPDVTANAAVVEGVARGYRDGGVRIGYYSLASFWTQVVGSMRTGAPEWRPAGPRGPGEAIRRCGADWSFGGGRGVLGQWLEDDRDRDVTCPGAVPDLGQWFHAY